MILITLRTIYQTPGDAGGGRLFIGVKMFYL